MYNHEPKNYECPFCSLQDKGNLNSGRAIYKDKYITAFISNAQWPKVSGIVIIVPNKHYENIYSIPDNLLAKIHVLAKKIALAMKKSYKTDGISVRQHNEPAGNQEVWHYHFQIMPRFKNDRLYINHEKKTKVHDKDLAKYTKIMRKALKYGN